MKHPNRSLPSTRGADACATTTVVAKPTDRSSAAAMLGAAEDRERLAHGRLWDPFRLLGRHAYAPATTDPAAACIGQHPGTTRADHEPQSLDPADRRSPQTKGDATQTSSAPPYWVLREFLPQAENAWFVDARGRRRGLTRVPGSDLFVADQAVPPPPEPYRVGWREKANGNEVELVSPWGFGPLIEIDFLTRFNAGEADDAHRWLGAHPLSVAGVAGVRFAVWAPGVQRVSVVGDFNGWHGLRHPLRSRGHSGVWELFVPGLEPGDRYKFEILADDGRTLLKADPYARRTELRPANASRVAAALPAVSVPADHRDPAPTPATSSEPDWARRRAASDWLHAPMSIYEVHAGSWRRRPDGGFQDWDELAATLIPYVAERNFTHIELLPVMEHPLDASWGYQVTGFFAPSARFGEPEGFRRFVEAAHRAGLGVILDWVPGHFPRDDWALARFTGHATYEDPDPLRGEHAGWGTLVFDYGRPEVQSFLLSSARHWIETYGIDGLRVDAVASMLYLDYSRNEWRPNRHGGREHLEAMAFLREMNLRVHRDFPGVVTIAEESTAWPGVSRPIELGGLGFSMKWNMGWMHDSLRYLARDPIHRRHHHDDLTFAQLYAWSENFVLPLSHDEVVHGKGSLLAKQHPGRGPDDRFATLRLLLAWQAFHPGKKLLFMGAELAQWNEWSEVGELDWALTNEPLHAGIDRLVADLNRLHRDLAALHRNDFDREGFAWLDADAASKSVFTFLRRADDTAVVCVINATPSTRDWRVGLPQAGRWSERLNTDATTYGGGNRGNLGGFDAESTSWNGQPASARILLPPLSALLFTHP